MNNTQLLFNQLQVVSTRGSLSTAYNLWAVDKDPWVKTSCSWLNNSCVLLISEFRNLHTVAQCEVKWYNKIITPTGQGQQSWPMAKGHKVLFWQPVITSPVIQQKMEEYQTDLLPFLGLISIYSIIWELMLDGGCFYIHLYKWSTSGQQKQVYRLRTNLYPEIYVHIFISTVSYI